MLELRGVDAFYGQSQALFDLSLSIGPGEAVSLMGRNGMGKTTAVRAVMGMVKVARGAISFGGEAITAWPTHRIARAGVGLVPEGRQIFPNLTVRENLVATAAIRGGGAGAWTLGKVFAAFPALAGRAAAMGRHLSGGEQQLLAIGRALMTNPRLLILDEATEGLAPLVREQIWRTLAELRRGGQAILVIDKDVAALTALCVRHYILAKGRLVWSGASAALAADQAAQHRYLGV
jgi:branched-chain amino acid transport system ATP-binding protein